MSVFVSVFRDHAWSKSEELFGTIIGEVNLDWSSNLEFVLIVVDEEDVVVTPWDVNGFGY
jgi:hypothetical protein